MVKLFRSQQAQARNNGEPAPVEDISPAPAPASLDVLVQVPGSPEIYIVSGGAKRLIPSMELFEALGYELDWVRPVPDHVLAGIPDAWNAPESFGNTVPENYQQWQNWDWSHQGEEWTVSPEWKQALIDDVLLRYVGRDETVLEIGPGAGRWTEVLQRVAKRLIVVDLSDKCIELCKRRFVGYANIDYFVNDGTNLDFIADDSIDYIWSFDVFVHVSPPDIAAYLVQFARVLRKGGRGVIHHAKEGGRHGGLRSAMSDELFASMVQQAGMRVATQFDSWGDGKFDVRVHRDVITVFELVSDASDLEPAAPVSPARSLAEAAIHNAADMPASPPVSTGGAQQSHDTRSASTGSPEV